MYAVVLSLLYFLNSIEMPSLVFKNFIGLLHSKTEEVMRHLLFFHFLFIVP